jgi:hypothetical protein
MRSFAGHLDCKWNVITPVIFDDQTPAISTSEDDSQGANALTVSLFQDKKNVEAEKVMKPLVAFDTKTLTPAELSATRATMRYSPVLMCEIMRHTTTEQIEYAQPDNVGRNKTLTWEGEYSCTFVFAS